MSPRRTKRPARRLPWRPPSRRPGLEWLEGRALPAAPVVPPALPVSASFVVDGAIAPGASRDLQPFAVPFSGRFQARLLPGVSALDLSLELYTQSGELLVRSDDLSPEGPLPLIDQHVPAGPYVLAVAAGRGESDGTAYRLDTSFTFALPPTAPLPAGPRPASLASADVNLDGVPDLAVTNTGGVLVSLGLGDGSYVPAGLFATGLSPAAVAVADVNLDRRPDLVVANNGNVRLGQVGSVSVLFGAGNGSFFSGGPLFAGVAPAGVAVGDVNQDGWPDIVVADQGLSAVGLGGQFPGALQVLEGAGAGAFHPARPLPAGLGPRSVALADVDLDGLPDLVTTNELTRTASVLYGAGGGAFLPPAVFVAGTAPFSVAVADVDLDGLPDLAVANAGNVVGQEGTVSVLAGAGGRDFRPASPFDVGTSPSSVAVADVNRDGLPDLVVANNDSADVSVLEGLGGGAFRPARSVPAGINPSSVAASDVNRDGWPDLVVSNFLSNNVSVVLASGNGSFLAEPPFNLGNNPHAVSADVNRDGLPDLVVANFTSGDVSVLLGTGDGAFLTERRFPAGTSPFSVAVADVNQDGRPDVVVANFSSNDVSLLLGTGDGTFLPQRPLAAGTGPFSVAVADVNRDGLPDLAVANFTSGDVSVLEGAGGGAFGPARSLPAGTGPVSVAVADVDGDGWEDLLVANLGSNDVSLLPASGGGGFLPERRLTAGLTPSAVAVADLDGDGLADLVIANNDSSDVTVRLGSGGGAFQAPRNFTVGSGALSVAVADVNLDQRPDIVIANAGQETGDDAGISVLLGAGGGDFLPQRRFIDGASARSVTAADVNRDGRPDLLVATFTSGVSILLGDGTGAFEASRKSLAVPPRSAPAVGDVNGDGVADLVTLATGGTVLYREGLPGQGPPYRPPVVVNPDRPGRDFALVRTAGGRGIAVAEPTGGLTLYEARGARFVPGHVVTAGLGPARLAAADLDRDGLDDLVAANSLGASVTVARQRLGGGFEAPRTLPVGTAPSDIAFLDLDGLDGPDVLVSNRSSGDVSVLYNDPAHTFARLARFRAGLSVVGAEVIGGRTQPRSLEGPVSLDGGDFTGDGRPDVVIVNQGASHFAVLAGTPSGGLANPVAGLRFPTGQGELRNDQAGQIRAADFDRDGALDAAVLMLDRGEVWLYRGDGQGRLALRSTVPAGNAPTGFSVADVNADGALDLMVGNDLGDVLFVLGNGDGTFRPFVRADKRVPFVVTDLNGDGSGDVVLADQARDQATAQLRTAGTASFTPGAFQRDGSDGLIGPGDVALADVDGAFGPDLIFANTGSNNVLVYLRTAGGSFNEAPLSFFSGTSPVALHLTQLNDDNGDGRINDADLLDLAVANQGSNDVSVLYGNRGEDVNGDGVIDGQDLFRLGPRLRTGGLGPNDVTTRDVTGDGIPDVLATNGQSGTLATIPGIGSAGLGSGFFDDAGTTLVGLSPGPVRQTSILAPDLGLALTQQGDLVRFGPSGAGAAVVFAPPAGVGIVAFEARDLGGDALLVFTANADGSVSALTSADGLDFRVATTLDSGLDSPGALEVLERANGLFDLYLTDSSEGRPVVITLQLRAEVVPVVPDTPFLLVVTLLTDFEPPPEGAEGGDGVAPVEVFDPLPAGQSTTLTTSLLAEATDEAEGGTPAVGGGDGAGDDGADPPVAGPDLQQFLIGLDEALKALLEEEEDEAKEEPDGPRPEGPEKEPIRPPADDPGAPPAQQDQPEEGLAGASPQPAEDRREAPPEDQREAPEGHAPGDTPARRDLPTGAAPGPGAPDTPRRVTCAAVLSAGVVVTGAALMRAARRPRVAEGAARPRSPLAEDWPPEVGAPRPPGA